MNTEMIANGDKSGNISTENVWIGIGRANGLVVD